jgi:hypothetical protein
MHGRKPNYLTDNVSSRNKAVQLETLAEYDVPNYPLYINNMKYGMIYAI